MRPQSQRLHNIAQTKAIVQKMKDNVTYKQLVLTIISSMLVSRRVAMDYLETAFFELDIEKDDFQ